ncbi:MAG TPA: class I SAM-dependent methyltransferase [Acidobacteriaceae bacterium]|nr:class I SAM-dependent methyltransferase [Acidobacteriaceae bacterium]
MAGRTAYLRRARHWIANRGWRGFLDEVWYRLRLKLQRKPVPGRENGNTRPHPFDVAYGVDTGGLLWGEALERPRSEDAAYWATGYYGISPSAFTAAMNRLHLDWPRYTFVDIGCGKGRALLLALRFPFRRVLGVELSPALAAVAAQNLEYFRAQWRQAGVPAEAVAGDATRFPLPNGPLLLFLYHPFATPVMKRFLAHLREAAEQEERDVYMLYANPELEAMVAGTPGFELMWKQLFSLTTEEGAADRFGSYGEMFAAFRLAGQSER